MKKAYFTISFLICVINFLACKQKAETAKIAHPIIKDKNVVIDYTDTHNGDTTLLFVHGWCLNKSYWDNQVAYFKNRYRVVAIDLPGFGKSGKNRDGWNTAAFGADVDSVISQLKLRNVILIGHSMAGDIVLQAAKHQPQAVIGLVGVDNFKGVATGARFTKADTVKYKQAIDSMRHEFRKFAADYFNQQLFYKTTSQAIRQRVLNDMMHTDPKIGTDCMELDNFDEAKELKAVGKKLCLINSDYTPTDTTGLHKNNIPFQVWYVHAVGHFPMVEKPADFNRDLADAIKHLHS